MSVIKQLSFSGGEVSPRLYSRVDQVRYAMGLRTCKNAIIGKDGGWQNRPGTTFVAELYTSAYTKRLIPFLMNATTGYVIEYGSGRLRFYRDGQQMLESAKAITTAVTQASPCNVHAVGHGYSVGDEVYLSGVGGMTQLNNRNFKVGTVPGADNFTLKYMDDTDVDSTGFGAYTSGGSAYRVVELANLDSYSDVSTLTWAQYPNANYLLICDLSGVIGPRFFTGSNDTTWSRVSTLQPAFPDVVTFTASSSGAGYSYKATGVDAVTLQESAVSAAVTSTVQTCTLTFTVQASTAYVNVYKLSANTGLYGYIGTAAAGSTFIDSSITPDLDNPPPPANPSPIVSPYPGCVNFYQQRLLFGGNSTYPLTVQASCSGYYSDFRRHYPVQEDDAITFTLAGRGAGRIKHMVDVGQLFLLTNTGEWIIQGDASGTLTQTAINPKQIGYNGSSNLQPLILDNTALFVQARGNVVRDLVSGINADGYQGNDLTIFATHLFEGKTITDWALQKIPNSIAWAVTSDGGLLGLTYVREQQIVAWHRHDTQGTFEHACAIPEGAEDYVYFVVKRTINGATKRYIERMSTRHVDDIRDANFMDCSLTYDGRNTGSTTMTLSGGIEWDHTETLTLTASASFFTAAEVGNAIHLTDADGGVLRFTITDYLSATVVGGKVNRDVPASLAEVATTTWARAVNVVTGLWHLEGEYVSILADGFVVASPNNPNLDTYIVNSGTITLSRPYAVITVGLPYISDLETLDVDSDQGETLIDKKKLITEVTLRLDKTRGLWVGGSVPTGDDALEGLRELKVRNAEGYDDPVALKSDVVKVIIKPEWNSNGRILVRQVDPLPASILSIAPSGIIPFRS